VAGAGIASGLITKLAARPVLVGGLAVMIAGLLLLRRDRLFEMGRMVLDSFGAALRRRPAEPASSTPPLAQPAVVPD
jgi:hypothetical protein